MKLYVAMIADRHTDTEPAVFSTPEEAVAYARIQAEQIARSPEDLREEEVDGWLYSATCGNEGDSVWVIEKTLDQP